MEYVFFYGTLMAPFERQGRSLIEAHLNQVGTGTIAAALFDLGLYPAAVPASDGLVHGEVHAMRDTAAVLAELDAIEGYQPAQPDQSLYVRTVTDVLLDGGGTVKAWVYFYNAPLGRAERIVSGDYLEHLRGR